MLSSHLGQETFLQGVSNYLKANAYGMTLLGSFCYATPTDVCPGNATTNDLWSALSEASGQDVHSFMVSRFFISPKIRRVQLYFLVKFAD